MIGIIGQGFVGNAVYQKFIKYYKVFTYDLDKTKCNSEFQTTIRQPIVFVCLPTPMNLDGSCNINLVTDTLKQIDNAKECNIAVIKSTVIPTTTKNLNKLFKNIDIVFNPEFLTEANAINDYENQSRIILGGPRPATTNLKYIFTQVFPKASIIKTDSTHAEMVKYITNTFLSVKVSYANQIQKLCEAINIDYDKVIEYATYDERIGKSHWAVPGPDGKFGYGGSCFPKDIKALIHLANEKGIDVSMLETSWTTNLKQRPDKDWEQLLGRAITKD
jgi:UDPglucose 6-dehydrogenase